LRSFSVTMVGLSIDPKIPTFAISLVRVFMMSAYADSNGATLNGINQADVKNEKAPEVFRGFEALCFSFRIDTVDIDRTGYFFV
jgi:hypothetical protein